MARIHTHAIIGKSRPMKVASSHKKSPFRVGFLAGLLAGMIASGVMFFISVTWGGILLPDVFGSKITAIMPPNMFESLHQLIGADAKTILFYIILIGQCLVFALSGGIFNARVKAQGEPLRWYHGLVLAAVLWLFAGIVLLPLADGGLFGVNLNAGIGAGMLSLGAVAVVFGLSFIYIADWLAASLPAEDMGASKRQALLGDEMEEPLSRRALLTRGLIIGGIAVAGVGIWRFIRVGPAPRKYLWPSCCNIIKRRLCRRLSPIMVSFSLRLTSRPKSRRMTSSISSRRTWSLIPLLMAQPGNSASMARSSILLPSPIRT